MSSALFRPPAALRWICPPALRSCRPFWSTSTPTSLPLSEVTPQTLCSLPGFPPFVGVIRVSLYVSESVNVEFVCNVLVVADQLLITRLKEICEVAITENRTSAVCHVTLNLYYTGHVVVFNAHLLLFSFTFIELKKSSLNVAKNLPCIMLLTKK